MAGCVRAVLLADPETGIWGCGQDQAGAEADLRLAWREHREVLESSGTLSPHLRRQLDVLRARDPEPVPVAGLRSGRVYGRLSAEA